MASGRKAFHFDLDEDRLKALYPSESKTGYKNAWGKIQAFMESCDFEHTQYSGYESIHGMDYAAAYTVLDSLQEKFPWFRECAKAATLTNIGKRHDVLEHLNRIEMDNEPTEDVLIPESHYSLHSEAKAMRDAARVLENNDKSEHEAPSKGEDR